jgi:hypothetical protein
MPKILFNMNFDYFDKKLLDNGSIRLNKLRNFPLLLNTYSKINLYT